MSFSSKKFNNVKKKYLKFIKTQEVLSEPFRDKINQLKNFYIPISKMIVENYKKNKTIIIGLSGGQGSGKSTISNIIKIILHEMFDLKTVIFSIDDFYKTRKERRIMASKISPLFLTRGVPGTHDTNFLFKCIQNLKTKKFKKFKIPKFDKSIDDRLKEKKWQNIQEKPNIVIFEGWCVGATFQKNKDLLIPTNRLEKEQDIDRIWRTTVNNELKKSYRKIFELIDKIIFLKVPNFQYVYKWRLLQEKKLKVTSKGKKTMKTEEIKNFIMFYERLTKHMLKNLPKTADVLVKIDGKHRLNSIKFN